MNWKYDHAIIFKTPLSGVNRQPACPIPSHLAAIRHYFKKLFWLQGRELLDKHQILQEIGEGCTSANFPFKKISEEFRLIPDKTLLIPGIQHKLSVIKAT